MDYEVRATPEFDEQLSAAVSYRMENCGRRSSRKLLDELERKVELLSANPSLGTLVDNETESQPSEALRWIRVDAYILAYRPHEDVGVIVLTKLFYATSNWRRHIMR